MSNKIRDAHEELTYDEFDGRTHRAAAGLASLGVAANDGVAIMLRNDIGFAEAVIATGLLGAYVILVNWHSTRDDLRFMLEDSGARTLVIHADLLRALGDLGTEGVNILVMETAPEVCDAYGIGRELGRAPAGLTVWAAWRDTFASWTGAAVLPPPGIFYTSGTTGRPKGVRRPPLTPESAAVFADVFQRSYGFMGEHGSPDAVVTVVTGPLYHGAPHAHGMFSIRSRADVTIMPRFEPEELLRMIEARRVTHLNMVPIMFNRLLKLPPEVRTKYDLSSLRFVAHAAAPISPAVKRAMIEWWGPVIHEYYGATEVGNVTFCSSEEWLAHPGTVGKAPPGYTVKILDADNRELPPGDIGEIVCRVGGTPDIIYINDDTKTRELERTPGLLAVGDVGYLDDDGFLYICDRSKDMIISGGVNIYPAQIEGALHTMPGVSDCAVFGVPDEDFGEAIYAVVEPQPGITLEIEQIRQYLRGQLPGYLLPQRIEIANNLPREDSGKIFKRRLREPFWAGHGRAI